MHKAIQATILICLLSVTGAGIWGSIGLCRHLISAIDAWGDSGRQMEQAVKTINQPKYGTLAEVDSTLFQLRLTIDAANKVAIHEQKQLGAFDGYAKNLDAEVAALSTHGNTALDAVAGSASEASQTLKTANGSIAALQPLESNLTATAASFTGLTDSLNARISNPSIDRIIGHIDTTTGHVDGVTSDFQKVMDKATADYLAPKPWWAKVVPYVNDGIRAGCLITGRCP